MAEALPSSDASRLADAPCSAVHCLQLAARGGANSRIEYGHHFQVEHHLDGGVQRFAGVQVVIDKPIQVGHFVRLESGQEGFVTKVGLRSTWIRMLPNNMLVVPNAKLISGQIINYYLPEPEMSTRVQVGVHYDSDLEHVERVTIEVARQIMSEIENGVPEFEPFIRYHTFGDSSINFTVILRTREVVGRYLIQHEFVKRLHQRYNEEGISIPFPIRTLDVNREDLEILARGQEPKP